MAFTFFYYFFYDFGTVSPQNRKEIVKKNCRFLEFLAKNQVLWTLVAYTFFLNVFFNFASKSGSVVGKGFWERETLPKSIKIKNRIQK